MNCRLPAQPNQSRWVLKIGLNPGARLGGSGEQYFIGQFDGKQFTNANPASTTLWTDYGKDCYCALTFNGLPASQTPVMIGWMDNWQYAAALPTSPWRGQMTIPRKLSLRNTNEGIRLFQEPADQLATLRAGPAETSVKSLPSHSFELNSTINLGSAKQVGWRLLEQNGAFTLIGYDRGKQSLFIDRTHSGVVNFNQSFPSQMDAPLKDSGELRLQIVVDRCSIELFANDGEVAMTSLVFPAQDANGIEQYEVGGRTGSTHATLWRLASTHQ